MATRAKVREAARSQATRSGRVPQSAIDAELKAFSDKDLRLRSVAPNVRQREAKRRLTDIEVAAGQPGTNLCRFTGMASSEKQRGKRPYFYKEKTVGRAGVDLCKKAVEDAWNDPAFLAEQRRVCGDDKEYVFPYKRKSGTVKGHCRNLHAPHPRARKAKPDPRLKQLDKLIAKRDKTNDMALNAKLSAEIRALRAELREPIQSEPDDISAFDFTSVRPTPTPPTDDPPPVPGTVDDAEAPATVPPPDDTDDPFVNPFTGVPGTGFDGTAAPAPKPAFNQRIYAYIESLPRGEKRKATDTLRQYVYGPGNMQPDDALQRYKERRVRDAQAPVGSTDFDDLAASDSDAEESDDDILGAGATYDAADMRQQQDIAADAIDDMQDLSEQESSTDRADDQPWSPGTMAAMPMFSELYTGANRRLVDARDNIRLMERANAMVTDAAGTMLALADPVAADAANSLVNLNGAGHCSDTILAGAGLTVY